MRIIFAADADYHTAFIRGRISTRMVADVYLLVALLRFDGR